MKRLLTLVLLGLAATTAQAAITPLSSIAAHLYCVIHDDGSITPPPIDFEEPPQVQDPILVDLGATTSECSISLCPPICKSKKSDNPFLWSLCYEDPKKCKENGKKCECKKGHTMPND